MWLSILMVVGLLIFSTLCAFIERDKKLFLPALCLGAAATVIIVMVGVFILYLTQLLSTGGL